MSDRGLILACLGLLAVAGIVVAVRLGYEMGRFDEAILAFEKHRSDPERLMAKLTDWIDLELNRGPPQSARDDP